MCLPEGVKGYMTDRKDILDAISREEALLVELDRQREDAIGRLHRLQSELKSIRETKPEYQNRVKPNLR